MPEPTQSFAERLKSRFGDRALSVVEATGEVTLETTASDWAEAIRTLRDDPEFRFEQLTDICGVDYLSYGDDEWDTSGVSSEGFSRGVEGSGPGRFDWENRPRGSGPDRRFAAVAHLQLETARHREIDGRHGRQALGRGHEGLGLMGIIGAFSLAQ